MSDKPEIVQILEDLLEISTQIQIPRESKPWWKFWERQDDPGWLWLDPDDPDYINVTWATNETHHNLYIDRKSFGADISRKTGEIYKEEGHPGAWTTALSIWPVYDPVQAARIYEKIVALIYKAANRPAGTVSTGGME